MKIHMFGKPTPSQNPASPLGVQYPAGARRGSIFRRWLIILIVLLSPFLLSLVWAFYQLAVVGAHGQVLPYEIEVRAGADGWVDSLYVQEGQLRTAGDTLAKLRNPDWEEMLMLTEPLPGSREGGGPANLGRLMAIQKERLERLRDYYQQLRTMDSTRSITRTELDRAWLEMKNAEFSLEQLRSENGQIVANRSSGKILDEQERLAYNNKIRVAQHRANRQWVINPDSGSVLSIYVKKGEYVEQGKRLFRVTQTSQVNYIAWLEPKHIGYAVAGRLCTIVFPDRQRFPAVISSSPRIDTNFRKEDGRTIDPLLQVDVKPLDSIPAKYLLAGMPFQLRIDVLLSDMESSRFMQLIGGNSKDGKETVR